jgi:hypothetical protein
MPVEGDVQDADQVLHENEHTGTHIISSRADCDACEALEFIVETVTPIECLSLHVWRHGLYVSTAETEALALESSSLEEQPRLALLEALGMSATVQPNKDCPGIGGRASEHGGRDSTAPEPGGAGKVFGKDFRAQDDAATHAERAGCSWMFTSCRPLHSDGAVLKKFSKGVKVVVPVDKDEEVKMRSSLSAACRHHSAVDGSVV